ncbi:MAG: glutamate--tRNA ligase [Planctomycetes bacterium]|nr:glutamate--tRNA ligase [Planctomycetota bacterium]
MVEAAHVRTRIAPSPTGQAHVGTAYAALFNYAFARRAGGQFLIRIEDTDRDRFVAGAEEEIYATLKWLGLSWDEGPDVGGACGPYRQSERLAVYREHVDRLVSSGAAYPCFCTSERLESMRMAQRQTGRPPGYDGTCRGLNPADAARRVGAKEPHVVRLRVPKEEATVFQDLLRGEIRIENHTIDDQVLLKTDGFPTYHLAVVVDDRLMRITHILRGEEWISSVPKHVLLYRVFGWVVPVMCHLPLLRNADRSKVSKRKNPTSLAWYRDRGYLPEAMVNFLGLMGYSMSDGRERFSLEEFVASFDPTRICLGGPVFDLAKLGWLNGSVLRDLPQEVLARRLREAGQVPAGMTDALLAGVLPIVRERIQTLPEFAPMTEFLVSRPKPDAAALIPKKRDAAGTAAVLRALREAYGMLDAGRWTPDALAEASARVEVASGWKKGDLYMVARLAVTGKPVTPPILESMVLLGRDETLARLERAVATLLPPTR